MRGLVDTLEDAARLTLLRELGKEATAFRFDVAPNPCVGAAVLAGRRVVAKGFHEVWGEAHAEVNALAAAERSGVPRSEWDCLAVTLEPCSSSGKTPPCIDAIRASGVKTVVVGALDPDPRHRGHGLEALRQAGLEVVFSQGAAPLDIVAPHFLRWTSRERVRRPRPWTIVKWAQTLTGQLTPPPKVGEGQWISGPESLAEVHILRSRVDAIVTGAGTVLADNPRLSVRPPGRAKTPPMRVILDSYLRTPADARLFAPSVPDDEAGPVHILAIAGADGRRARALKKAGAHVHGLRGADKNRLDLREVQTWLYANGARRVLVEAGPTLVASYFETSFADQIRVVTGNVRGGRGESLARYFSDLRLLERRDYEVGEDAVLDAFLEPR